MEKSEFHNWWQKHLIGQPVGRVVVCGNRLQPPLCSQVCASPRVEMVLNGIYETRIEQDGKMATVQLHPGSALFVAPNCWSFPTGRCPVEVMTLLFDKKQLELNIVSCAGSGEPQLLAQKFVFTEPLSGPLPHILEAMLSFEAAKGQGAFPDLMRALLQCIGQLEIELPSQEPDSRAQSFFERVCIYLEEHFHKEITRESVAQQFHITPNHLSRLFHAHGDMVFIEYLTSVRIAHGKILLANGNLKLEDIAAQCGFRDAAYFCRVFKRLTKVTPIEYRSRRLLEQEKARRTDGVNDSCLFGSNLVMGDKQEESVMTRSFSSPQLFGFPKYVENMALGLKAMNENSKSAQRFELQVNTRARL